MSDLVDIKLPNIRFSRFTDDWEQSQFGELICSLLGGASIKPSDYRNRGVKTVPKSAVNATGIADLVGSKLVSETFHEKHTSNHVSSGDLITTLRDLVPSAPNLGRVVKIEETPEEFLMPQGVFRIGLFESTDENFLIAYSNRNEFRKIITDEKNGSTQVHLRSGQYLSIAIHKPEHHEQRQVGSYFKSLNHLIQLHQRKHDKLVILKQAMLQKMFPQDGATTPEVRFKGFEGSWVRIHLCDICDSFQYGLNASAKEYDGRNKYIRITDIVESTRNFSQASLTTPDADIQNSDEYLLSEGDILFARTGASVGKTYRYTKEDGRVFFAGFLIRAQLMNTECVDFVFYSTLTYDYQKFVTVTSQRSGQPGINAAEYSTFSLTVPSGVEQQKIGKYFRNLDNLISKHTTQLEKLKNIKSACLDKMFV